ncbi:MAG: redoxin domain-containing protein [Ignavibacteriales bacterium]|nr:redoxin domain-containing protein [Ignavibacteriales bacterium]
MSRIPIQPLVIPKTIRQFFIVFTILFVATNFVQSQTTIRGTLLGVDSNPLPRAHVHLLPVDGAKPLASVQVSKTGSFTLQTSLKGLVFLDCTGVGHQRRRVPLYIEPSKTIELSVSLETYHYLDTMDSVKVIGDFNNFSEKNARPMVKLGDGTYALDIETTANALVYQLIGITRSGNSVNGTQSDDYVYDGGGDYQSVVTAKNGKARIIFNSKLLISRETLSQVRFQQNESLTAQYVKVYSDMLSRRDSLSVGLRSYRKSGKPLYAFNYDWSKELSVIAKQLERERNSALRQLLLFSYLDIGYGAYGADLEPSVVQNALKEIPPTSYLWSLEPDLVGVALRNSTQPLRYSTYVQKIIQSHPDQKVRKNVLSTSDPSRRIVPGKKIPEFSFVSLDDSTAQCSPKQLRGKVFLIDFWATWCAPCLDEMDNLHRVYNNYKDKGFEIVSLSFDKTKETTQKFRKDKWKMPWFNSYVKEGLGSSTAKEFEISGLPKPILVDRNGVIIAMGIDVRGSRLEKTLQRVINKEKR